VEIVMWKITRFLDRFVPALIGVPYLGVWLLRFTRPWEARTVEWFQANMTQEQLRLLVAAFEILKIDLRKLKMPRQRPPDITYDSRGFITQIEFSPDVPDFWNDPRYRDHYIR
jgi:hypothetical protein